MTLRELSSDLYHPVISGSQDTVIKAIAYDSRKVRPGTAFFALRGSKVDGHDYIDTAIKAGASAIIAEAPPPPESNMPWIHISDTRKALALMAATFHGHPARKLGIAGITGTNGKTTITFLVHHLVNASQSRCGMMGTVCYDLGNGESYAATHTTPESLEIQENLAAMNNNGCRSVAMEVSSHALDQSRVYGIPFRAAVFTNLTQDHLDYHETMQRYFDAKTILFEATAKTAKGHLVINTDDSWGKKLNIKFSGAARIITYGMGAMADLRANNVRYDINGTAFELTAGGRQFLVRTPLIGDFNVYNTLAALGAAKALGINFREAVRSLQSAPQVPGRLERIPDESQRFSVFVDYAHTPDALVNALRTLRLLRPRRIITVFGCGGDRDRTKRAAMGRAVQDGSDACIITSDNPRTEDPTQIMADIVKGFTRKCYVEIPARGDAIREAISSAQAGDIVLLAGKGHETYQEVHGVKHPFDDRRVAHGAIMALKMAKADKIAQRISAIQEEEQHREFISPEQPEDDGQPRRRWNE